MQNYEPRPKEPLDQPLDILLIDEEIVVVGPGSVAFSMTVTAARVTCRKLCELLESIEAPASHP